MRKLQLQKEKNQLMQKELQKQFIKPVEKIQLKEKQKQEENKNLMQQKLPQTQPIQPQTKPIGEKTIFADLPKPQTTLPVQGGLKFENIRLG